ncbi:MaoC/PaaZ C-terminal domain-containing protein [Rhodococcus sp. NPDC056743]|uniref:MaoC/PaaZ C-terminal domain-containing protein n=1 Tax=Rhodococcus sp. NPDC056743 TaxID=3345934 RepID=UPI0036721924
MSPQVYFDDIETGDTIPVLAVSVTQLQMFLFSAATYNGHRIHYDRSWAVDVEGYQDVVVQGPLQAALLARVVTDWIGGAGSLVNFSASNRAVAFPGEPLEFTGTVTGKRDENGRALVDLDLAGVRGGEVLMPGTATVLLPRRGTAAADGVS